MSRTLLIGPWSGEFGFEVALWAPHARARSRAFDRTIVACEPGHEALYDDFASDFIRYPCPSEVVVRDCEFGHTTEALGTHAPHVDPPKLATCDEWLNPNHLRRVMVWNHEHLMHIPGLWQPKQWRPRFMGSWNTVVIHARSGFKQPNKSWPREKWIELVDRLYTQAVAHVVVVCGTEAGAFHVERCASVIGNSVEDLASQLRVARMMIGPSSGPLALASHCGVPCVWWADDTQPAAQLYDTEGPVGANWNPNHIKHHRAAVSWDPSVDEVWTAVQAALH